MVERIDSQETDISIPQAQFVHTRRVNFSDTDMAGIVHFSNYYRYMEEAEHAFFRSLGLSIMYPMADDVMVGWPRVSSQCNYEAPARYDDLVDIHVNIERVGVKSVTYQMNLFVGEKRIARGRMKTACCLCRADHTLESIEIPAEYRAVLMESPFVG